MRHFAGWNVFDLSLVLVSCVDVASLFFTRNPTLNVLQAVKILKMLSALAFEAFGLMFQAMS